MFDVAPTELLLVAIVALVVIGPKDLPRAMRFVGKWMGKARGMARHFRSGIDTMMRESELEELEQKWREQNAAIMREFPRADADAATSSPAAHLPAPEADAQVDPEMGATPADLPVETHAVPPVSRDLP